MAKEKWSWAVLLLWFVLIQNTYQQTLPSADDIKQMLKDEVKQAVEFCQVKDATVLADFLPAGYTSLPSDNIRQLASLMNVFPGAIDAALLTAVKQDGNLPDSPDIDSIVRSIAKSYQSDTNAHQSNTNSLTYANTLFAKTSSHVNEWEECNTDLDYFLRPITKAFSCILNQAGREICYKALPKVICNGFFDKPIPLTNKIQPWSLVMLDAAFKPPPGIAEGKLHLPGSYDECMNIDSAYNLTGGGERAIQGGYCRADIGVKGDGPLAQQSLQLGICIPKTCAASNITENINSKAYKLEALDSLNLEIKQIFCGHDLHMSSDRRAQLIIALSIILVIIACVATVYDMFFRQSRLTKILDENKTSGPRLFRSPSVHYEKNKEHVTMGGMVNSGMAGIMEEPHPSPSAPALARNISYVSVHEEDYARFTLKSRPNINAVVVARPVAVGPPPADVAVHREAPVIMSADTYLAAEPSFTERLEVAFVGSSVYSSVKSIFSPQHLPENYFKSCDAIRVLSFAFSMFGLTYALLITFPDTFIMANPLILLEFKKFIWFQPMINFTYCVDSFLVIAGCLTAFNWLQRVADNGGKLSPGVICHYYLHRYWSLLPAFMLTLALYACMYKYLIIGPLNPPQISDAENCKTNWWTNLLMINNLVHVHHTCMQWTWFIPMLFQLHIIAPIILIPLVLKPFVGYVMVGVVYIIHLIVTGVKSAVLYDSIANHTGPEEGINEWLTQYAFVPWCKAGAYLVGIVLGIVMYRIRTRKQEINIHPILSIIGWVCAIGTIAAVSFHSHSILNEFDSLFVRWSKTDAVATRMLGHTAWGIGVAWMIFCTETGNSGVLGSLLKYDLWGPISRTVYMAYLVSAIIILRNYLINLQLIYIEDNSMFYHAVANCVISVALGLALSLIYQFPFIGIDKALNITTRRQAFHIARSPLDDDEGPEEYDDIRKPLPNSPTDAARPRAVSSVQGRRPRVGSAAAISFVKQSYDHVAHAMGNGPSPYGELHRADSVSEL